MATKVKKKVSKAVIPVKTWGRMSKMEKRVALAEDILAQIKVGTLVPARGIYVSVVIKDDDFGSLEYKQLNKAIQANEVKCECCGIGSFLIAHVNKTNHCTVGNSYEYDDSNSIKGRLGKLFSEYELDIIETCFEGRVINNTDNKIYDGWNYTGLGEKCLKFHRNYSNSENILKAICKNIIKNKGKFIL